MDSVWVTLFVCVACYAYNRKSVSFVSPKLIEEGLDPSDAGLILTCQNGAFALSKFVVGVLSDRTSPRLVFVIGLVTSGVVTVLFSSASTSDVGLLCAFWALNGLAQGCGWPSCAKIIRQRALPSQFGTLWSVLSSANNFSGSVCPFVSSFLVLHFGWRTSVCTAGFISVAFAVVGAIALKSTSGDNGIAPTKRKTEKSNKERDDESGSSLLHLVCDPFLLMVSGGYLVVFCTRSALVDWGQLYLIGERGRSHQEGSAFASSIETGGLLGRIAAGYITDKLIQFYSAKGASSQSSVRLSVAVLSLVASVGLLHALQVSVTHYLSTSWITTIGFLLGASLYGPIAIFGIVSTESAPAHLSGRSNAIAALAANLGAMLSGFPCCYLAKHYSWSSVFLLLEVATSVILITLLLFRNLKPMLERQKKED